MSSCGQCEEKEAVLLCQQCEETMCQECWDSLHARGKMRDHRTLRLSVSVTKPGERPKSVQQDPNTYCSEHKGELKTLFCTTHQKIVCAQCLVVGECKGHQCQPLKAYWLESRSRIKEQVRAIDERILALNDAKERLDGVRSRVELEEEVLQLGSKDKLTQIREELKEKQSQLAAKVKVMETEKLTQLTEQQEALNREAVKCAQSVGKAEKKILVDDAYDFFENYWETQDEMVKRLKKKVDLEPVCNSDFNVTLETRRQKELIRAIEWKRGKSHLQGKKHLSMSSGRSPRSSLSR